MDKLYCAEALNGVAAICVQSCLKESDKVYIFKNIEEVKNIFDCESEDETVNLINEIFIGGAKQVYCVCLDIKKDYLYAFSLLEKYKFNTLCVDTEDNFIHIILSEFINKLHCRGNMCFGVIGEGSDIPFETRLKNAKFFNSYAIVYIGASAVDVFGNKFEGKRAAARLAGIISAVPSECNIVRKRIKGVVGLNENLLSYEYELADLCGMVVFGISKRGNVYIKNAITTFNYSENKNNTGWKKIRNTKVRFELIQRVNDTVKFFAEYETNKKRLKSIFYSVQMLLNIMYYEKKFLEDIKILVEAKNKYSLVFICAYDVDSYGKSSFIYSFYV